MTRHKTAPILLLLLLLLALLPPIQARADTRPLHTMRYEIDLTEYEAVYLPELTEALYGFGFYTYAIESYSDTFFDGSPSILYDSLMFTPRSELSPGASGTVEIGVKKSGVDLCLFRLEFATQNQTAGQVTGVAIESKPYDGAPAFPVGSPQFTLDSGQPIAVASFLYSYAGECFDGSLFPTGETPPIKAGSYTLVIHVSDPVYSGRSAELPFVITKRPLEITARSIELLAGDPLPTEFPLEYDSFAEGEGPFLFGEQPPAAAIDPSFTTDTAGDTEIYFSYCPELPNYSVSYRPGSLTVIDEFDLDESYFDAPAPNEAGWYREDIVLRPSGLDGFDLISLDPAGPFEEEVSLWEETAEGSADLYLRRGGYLAEPLPFSYQLDKTPPQLTAAYLPPSGSGYGLIAAEAEDELSGLAELSVTGPSGAAIAETENGFPVTGDGYYTVSATDTAGNRISATQYIALEEEDDGAVEWWSSQPLSAASGWISFPTGTRSASSGAGRDNDEAGEDADGAASEYWGRVESALRRAADGTGVSIAPERFKEVPATVLDALRGRDVYLRIRLEDGGAILLHGQSLPEPDASADSYSLRELEKMARDAARVPKTDPTPIVPAANATGDAKEEDIPAEDAPAKPDRTPQVVSTTTLLGEAAGGGPPVMAVGQSRAVKGQSPAAVAVTVLLSLAAAGAVAAALLLSRRS